MTDLFFGRHIINKKSMKKKLLICWLVFAIAITFIMVCITAQHNRNEYTVSSNTSSSLKQTDADVKEDYSYISFDNLPDEICEIILSGRDFIVSETGERANIFNVNFPRNIDKRTLYWKYYSVIDFDSDGQNELFFVVEDELGLDVGTVIFCLINENVYAYIGSTREFSDIFSDRTIIDREGASVVYYYRIKGFSESGYEKEVIASGNGLEGIFVIEGKVVTDDIFWNSYMVPLTRDKERIIMNKALIP